MVKVLTGNRVSEGDIDSGRIHKPTQRESTDRQKRNGVEQRTQKIQHSRTLKKSSKKRKIVDYMNHTGSSTGVQNKHLRFCSTTQKNIEKRVIPSISCCNCFSKIQLKLATEAK